jgi:hypothetical protein
MSPMLALIMRVLMSDSLVDADWKTRQAAFNIVRITLGEATSKGI